MKKLLTALLLLCVCTGLAKDVRSKNPLMASRTVVWAGLDYSMVRMIGTDNMRVPYTFGTPDIIFPGMLEEWNRLFLEERIGEVSKNLEKRVLVDIGGVTENNKNATANQITLTSNARGALKESQTAPQEIARLVRSYKLQNTNRLGLVFIVDKLVRSSTFEYAHGASPNEINISSGAAIYVVFFDIETREVLSSERQVYGVSSGGNFRNFWFWPIKDADVSLRKYRVAKTSENPAISTQRKR